MCIRDSLKGLFQEVFERADDNYKAALDKWGKNFPSLYPEFYNPKNILDEVCKSKTSPDRIRQVLTDGSAIVTTLKSVGLKDDYWDEKNKQYWDQINFKTHDDNHWSIKA